MKTMKRRIGVAGVAAAVVAGAFSTSHAGAIPWLYDAIFGPAYYSSYYGPYAPTYGVGYMPSGCKTSCSPCSTGKCSPVVAYCNPCEASTSKCDVGSPNWRAGDAPTKANIKTEVRTPTFSNTKPDYRDESSGPDVDPRTGERILKKAVIPQTPMPQNEFSPPTTVDPARPTFKRTAPPPANDVNPGFGTDNTATEGTELLPPRNAKPAETEVPPTLNQESRATWKVTPATAQSRTLRKPSFSDASIARRSVEVPATPTTTIGTSIVKK